MIDQSPIFPPPYLQDAVEKRAIARDYLEMCDERETRLIGLTISSIIEDDDLFIRTGFDLLQRNRRFQQRLIEDLYEIDYVIFGIIESIKPECMK